MAKKKLTIDDVLVPKEEIPYEVPENWCWVKLGGMADCLDKFRKPINATERSKREGYIPYYGATGQVGWIDDYLLDEEVVLVGEDGAPFFDLLKNKAYIIEGKSWVNNHAHILKSKFGSFSNKYLMHYLNIFDYNGYVNGTTRLKLTQKKMLEIPIPIPPLAEQERIVNCIESLFDKVDKAVCLVAEAREGFEKRRAAILEMAFSGELTKKWRDDSAVSDGWEVVSIKDILNPMTTKKPNLEDEIFRYIDIDAIDNKKQEVREPKVLEFSKAPSRASREVREGDTLFSLVRPYLKNIAYISDEFNDCIASTGFYVCRPNERVLPKYLYNILCSDKTINFYTSMMKGDNSPSIRKGEFESLEISLPSIDEQREVIKIVDKLLETERNIEELCEIDEYIDITRKSILAKAFRGELGSNNLNEESSIELLKDLIK